jgi:filamentous hemagglutinin
MQRINFLPRLAISKQKQSAKLTNYKKNTMFPKDWSVAKIQAEIDSAWARRTDVDGKKDMWEGKSDSGVKITGYKEPRAATKAAYINSPAVQQILHSFGDSFAHVQEDGSHYDSVKGHAVDSKTGNDPDNPNIHADAYKNYVNSLFSVASQVTTIPRVSNSAITYLSNRVTASSTEAGQAQLLNTAIGSVTKAEASSLVNSPVPECGLSQNCQNIGVNSRVEPIINKIYGIK